MTNHPNTLQLLHAARLADQAAATTLDLTNKRPADAQPYAERATRHLALAMVLLIENARTDHTDASLDSLHRELRRFLEDGPT